MTHKVSFYKRIGWSVFYGVVAWSLPLSADMIPYSGVNGQQQYEITTTGTYQIVAYGAQGGATTYYGNVPGGQGAEIGGDFTLTAGTILDVYIGQQGVLNAVTAGGGGGTFIALDSSGSPGQLLIAAGGGGGAAYGDGGMNASLTTSGVDGNAFGGNGGVGGTNGNGGGSAGAGGGGGAYLSGGGGSSWAGGGASFPSLAGGSDVGGGEGGYGGGGGGAYLGGGGGGGYSGGGGGGNERYDGVGGGGGSYIDASTQVIESIGNTGNGYVTIDPLSSAAPEPEPLLIAGVGLFAILIVRRFRLASIR